MERQPEIVTLPDGSIAQPTSRKDGIVSGITTAKDGRRFRFTAREEDWERLTARPRPS